MITWFNMVQARNLKMLHHVASRCPEVHLVGKNNVEVARAVVAKLKDDGSAQMNPDGSR